MTHLLVVTAGMGAPSTSRMLGDRLAAATATALAGVDRPAPQVRVLELRDLAADLAHLYTSGLPSPRLTEAFGSVRAASGVIVVSPVLNGGMSGLFKLFFDLLDEDALAGRPVLLAATGGTARHSLAIDQSMLPMFFHLRAAVAPTAVFAATADWGGSDAEGASRDEVGLIRRIERAGKDFAGLVAARPGVAAPDPFADVDDFATLLGA